MNSLILFILCLFAFVALFVFSAQFLWRWIVTYKVTESGIEVLLFGLIPESKTKFQDIVDVRKVSFVELLPWKNLESAGWFRLGNRLWGDGVLVRRRRGIFRSFVITPDEPDEFVKEVKFKIKTSEAPELVLGTGSPTTMERVSDERL